MEWLVLLSVVICIGCMVLVVRNIIDNANYESVYVQLDKITNGDKLLCNSVFNEAVRRHGKSLTIEQAVAVLEEMQLAGVRKP